LAQHTAARGQKGALTTDGATPTPLAHAYAADLLLESLGAEAHEVTVHLDWASLEASTTAGSIAATRTSESVVTVELRDFPISWVSPTPRRLTGPVGPSSRWCRFLFHVHDAPPGGVLTSAPGGKPTPWAEQALESGIDMAAAGPLLAAKPARELIRRVITRKNRRLDALDRFLEEPFAEPEYAEANAKYLEAMVAELEAAAQVIDRTARTVDLGLVLRLAQPPKGQ
jgi:hypothetical protein